MKRLRAWFVRLFDTVAGKQRDFADAVQSGMSHEDARRQALIRLGGLDLTREQYHVRRALPWLETLAQDVRYGSRIMVRSPGFTATAVLTLGLGIGATTAIFTVVNAALLRPLPFPEPDRLVYIKQRLESGINFFTWPKGFAAWRSRGRALSMVAAYMNNGANLTGAGEAEQVETALVTSQIFPMLGMKPLLGRTFSYAEDQPGGPPVALVSESLWRRRFGASQGVIGSTITLDQRAYEVIGVVPWAFQIPDQFHFRYDVWLPLVISDAGVSNQVLVRSIGRLGPGVTLAQAQAELDTILQSTLRKNQKARAALVEWREEIAHAARRSLLIIMAAVGFVLLIACVNVANLLLSRAAAREKELSVRLAIGAGRGRIIRQLLTESILLATAGGALGLALGYWTKDLLVAFLADNLPTLNPVQLDYRVLAFTLAVAVATGLVCGMAPALQLSRHAVQDALKGSGRGISEGLSHRRLRDLLVVTEVALAMILLIGSGLLLRSFLLLRSAGTGFRTENILTMRISVAAASYPTLGDQVRFFRQVLESVGNLAGVEATAAAGSLPLGRYGGGGDVELEGRRDFEASVQWVTVTPGYFGTLGIPVLRGRGLSDGDREGAPRAAVVSESFARAYFPNQDCLGKRFMGWNKSKEWTMIVGVVGDVHDLMMKGEAEPQVYFPHAQADFSVTRTGKESMTVIVRTHGDPRNLANAIRSRIVALDKDQPVQDLTTYEDLRARFITPERINTLLFGAFAFLGLVLGSIGIYGVMSYSVSRQIQEIGIRLAMGARGADVLSSVLRHGLLLILMGDLIGAAGALALTRLLTMMLFHVNPTDPLTYAAVALIWTAVGLAACYVPARRAAGVNPPLALRCE